MAFAGFEVPIQMAVSAEKLIFGVGGVDPQRRAELINVRWSDNLMLLFCELNLLSSYCPLLYYNGCVATQAHR